jgi:hypothetical protein
MNFSFGLPLLPRAEENKSLTANCMLKEVLSSQLPEFNQETKETQSGAGSLSSHF